MSHPVRKLLVPVIIVVAAVAVSLILVRTRKKPPRFEKSFEGALVEVLPLRPGAYRFEVSAQGTVTPAREVALAPQVTGRITAVHPRLVAGGLVAKGEVLVHIDDSDYRIAAAEAESAVQQARAALVREEGQQQVARRELEFFEKQGDTASLDRSLALREPQLAAAKAQVDAARSRLERARIDLERTRIQAPMNALVTSESAEVGQLAGPQAPLAVLVGTDAYWVRAAVPMDALPHVQIPGINAERGSRALLRQDMGGRTVVREGRVLRLLGDLDPAGRMARLIVEVAYPMKPPWGAAAVAGEKTETLAPGGEKAKSGSGSAHGQAANQGSPRIHDGHAGEAPEYRDAAAIPLLLESYLDLTLYGPEEQGLVAIPRTALRDGGRVHLYRGGVLEIAEVDIAWKRPDTIFVRRGLGLGDSLVVSQIPTPLEGMRLRLPGEAAASTQAHGSGAKGAGNEDRIPAGAASNGEPPAQGGTSGEGGENKAGRRPQARAGSGADGSAGPERQERSTEAEKSPEANGREGSTE